MDQDACTRPDTTTHFTSKQDAVKRLIRYHCMYEEHCEENEEEEVAFKSMAQEFPIIYRNMLNKYQYLLMQESTVRLMQVYFSFIAYNFFLSFFFKLAARPYC